MRIEQIKLKDYPPIKNLELSNLGSIVIIAGANGAGKTRLKEAILSTFQGSPNASLRLIATRKEEREEYFQGGHLDVEQHQPNQLLTNYINSRRYGRGKYVGSLVQVDSRRSIQTISYSAVNWLGEDPDDQDIPPTFYFNDFGNRWQDFMNYIHQKSAIRDKKLAAQLKLNPDDGRKILARNPDPLDKFAELFHELLPDKTLEPIDPASPREFSYKSEDGTVLPFSTLSSGEQEVVKIVFDIARKDINHSVIIIDEPELHLHPSLTFKLVETLKRTGEHTNQYFFLTHSPDLISTYFATGDVYFIDSDRSGANQAHRLSDLSSKHNKIAQLMGENLGLFAVGKKILFIEGEDTSVDKITYSALAERYLPEAKVVPLGSVKNILSMNVIEKEIRNAIFGISFYMLRDRDGLTQGTI